jgi:periodic tryptophan protein 1
MISALAWIPKGASRSKPVRFELSEEEVHRIENLAKYAILFDLFNFKIFFRDEEEIEKDQQEEFQEEISSDEEEGTDTREQNDNFEGLPAELRMDEYDDEDDIKDILELDNEADDNDDFMGDLKAGMDLVDDEEEEDDEIKPSDSVLLLAMTEDEYSHLEVQILTKEGSLYTHHDIILPDFPLCLAWLDCPPYKQSTSSQQQAVGSYIAVGTMDPAIEIWNLDIMDPIEPSAILGGEDPTKTSTTGKKSKKNSLRAPKKHYLPGSHESGVMALSWNTMYRQAIASASADNTVKIWDVTTQACSYTFTHHLDKVRNL